MASLRNSDGSLISATEAVSNDSLKLWLCELTHLSVEQIDQLMAQREQQQLSTLPSKLPR
jgi:hypothetical protein